MAQEFHGMRRASAPFRPSASSLALLDQCARGIVPDDEVLIPRFERYLRHHRRRIAFDLDLVGQYAPPGAKIVEFGATPLFMTVPLASLSLDVVGIDLDPSRFSKAIERHKLCVFQCDIEQERVPLPDNTFDLALFNELFEHLRFNPLFTMREIHRLLKPNGILLLSTPNLASLKGYINFLFNGKGFSLCGDIYEEHIKCERDGYVGHIREYTPREITDFLTIMGFQVDVVIFREQFDKDILPQYWNLALHLFPRLRPFVTYVARVP
jgi:SAM-dependent methyltransferase